MFDASKFSAQVPTPVLGNSEHPVARYTTALTMRWFDKTAAVAVVGLKDLPAESHYRDCKSVTYRPQDGSIQFHRHSPKELKAMWDSKVNFNSPYEPVDVPGSDKYVGNTILREIVE